MYFAAKGAFFPLNIHLPRALVSRLVRTTQSSWSPEVWARGGLAIVVLPRGILRRVTFADYAIMAAAGRGEAFLSS